MRTTRGPDRLAFFTDAVTAIAITLLILPVVELVPEAAQGNATASAFFTAHFDEIVSFLISFSVIARLWVAHHAIFEHVASYTGWLMFLSLFWAFTVVVLPLPTAMSAEFEPSRLVLGFYIGTMAVNSMTLSIIAITVSRNPDIESSENPITSRFVHGSVTISSAFVLAFLLAMIVPTLSYWSMLVLFLAPPAEAILRRRDRRRERVKAVRRNAGK